VLESLAWVAKRSHNLPRAHPIVESRLIGADALGELLHVLNLIDFFNLNIELLLQLGILQPHLLHLLLSLKKLLLVLRLQPLHRSLDLEVAVDKVRVVLFQLSSSLLLVAQRLLQELDLVDKGIGLVVPMRLVQPLLKIDVELTLVADVLLEQQVLLLHLLSLFDKLQHLLLNLQLFCLDLDEFLLELVVLLTGYSDLEEGLLLRDLVLLDLCLEDVDLPDCLLQFKHG
jgi:hypothetical protein